MDLHWWLSETEAGVSANAFCMYGSMEHQVFWFRLFGAGLWLGGPKQPVLFSERNGFMWRLPLGFGWRVKMLPAFRCGAIRKRGE